MHGLLLGVITPDNTPHGANLTFLLPDIGFIVIAVALFLRFRGRHKVPGHAGPATLRTQPAQAAARPGGSAGGPAPGGLAPEGPAPEGPAP